jgi:type IV secretory pathway VirB6-like protein
MQSAGQGLYTLFLQDGWDLLGLLGLIMTSWYLMIFILEGHMPRFFVSELQMLIKVGVVAFMLTTWTSTTHDFFVGNMQTMASRVAGGDPDASGVLKTLWGGVQSIFSGARQQSAQNCQMVPDTTPEGQVIPGSEHQVCSDVTTPQGSGVSTWQLLTNLPYVLLMFAAKILACIALLVMGFAFVVVIQLGSFLLNISFCLGPVLIPWLVLPQVSYLFDGWLRFTIIAGLYKVVAWILMTLIIKGALPSINAMVQTVATTSASSGADYFASNVITILGLAFVCAIGAFFMWQAPGIASAIVSGAGGVATKGFGGGVIGRGLRSLGG